MCKQQWEIHFAYIIRSIPVTCSDQLLTQIALITFQALSWNLYIYHQVNIIEQGLFYLHFADEVPREYLVLNPNLPDAWASLLQCFEWSCHHPRRNRCCLVPSYSRFCLLWAQKPQAFCPLDLWPSLSGDSPTALKEMGVQHQMASFCKLLGFQKRSIENHTYIFSLS